jgi:hypothetical protein
MIHILAQKKNNMPSLKEWHPNPQTTLERQPSVYKYLLQNFIANQDYIKQKSKYKYFNVGMQDDITHQRNTALRCIDLPHRLYPRQG